MNWLLFLIAVAIRILTVVLEALKFQNYILSHMILYNSL